MESEFQNAGMGLPKGILSQVPPSLFHRLDAEAEFAVSDLDIPFPI